MKLNDGHELNAGYEQTAEQKLNRYMRAERSLSILYPRTCPVCGKLLKIKRDDIVSPGNPFICWSCDGKLDRLADVPRCLRCSKPIDDPEEEYCRDCLKKERHFDLGFAPLLHNEVAREIMYDLKYRGLKCNADFAAYEMVRALIGSGGDICRNPFLEVDAIIPVPLHAKRKFERGYNQAALIAKRFEFFLELAGHDPIPVDENYLVRGKSSERLKEMSGSERVAALSGVFSVSGEPNKYRKVLIVDDIFTTGATLNECAKTLRHAGASVIYFMTATIGN